MGISEAGTLKQAIATSFHILPSSSFITISSFETTWLGNLVKHH
jgi:hypothetical protein